MTVITHLGASIQLHKDSIGVTIPGMSTKDGGQEIIHLLITGLDAPVLRVWNDITNDEPIVINMIGAWTNIHLDILQFHCPECNAERTIEQVLGGAVVASTLQAFNSYVEHDSNEIVLNAETCRYQCLVCGHVIKDEFGNEISTEEELIEWLKENGSK